jgi:hypothetical protein
MNGSEHVQESYATPGTLSQGGAAPDAGSVCLVTDLGCLPQCTYVVSGSAAQFKAQAGKI